MHSYQHEQGHEDDAKTKRMEMLRILRISTAQQVFHVFMSLSALITGTNVQLIADSE
jgi:hypothetical protein